jgi:hypothetical protein
MDFCILHGNGVLMMFFDCFFQKSQGSFPAFHNKKVVKLQGPWNDKNQFITKDSTWQSSNKFRQQGVN